MEKKREIVTNILGSYSRRGNEHLYSCPYCNHHKKKLSVNYSLNVFKCWVCDTSGKNIYRIVRKFGTYQQRQKYLELDGRLDLTEFDKIFDQMNEVVEQPTVDLPSEFVSLCNKRLPRSSKRALDYLYDRGISKQDILFWKMGYCDEGRYGGRIVIPSFNANGDCNYYVSRSYCNHMRKYLNPPADRDIIFNELYIDWDEPVILVEGVFDAVVAGTNAIPILGSTFRSHTRLFQAIAINDIPVYIALDPDAEKKAGHIIRNMLKYDIETHVVDLTGCEDVGSLSREEFENRKRSAELVDQDMYFLMKQHRRING